jgi:hypothetical protein
MERAVFPEQVWTMVVGAVVSGTTRVRDALGMLTVNKLIVGIARVVAGRLGRVRCTVAHVPRAIGVFVHARELRVVGGEEEEEEEVEAARAALEGAGARFYAFVSDETDSKSKLAWLPRLPLRSDAQPEAQPDADPSGYEVVCVCSETKRFCDVAESLALAVGMRELVVDYLGVRDVYPTLARLGCARVTIQQADFDLHSDGGGFTSTAVTELAFKWCDLARLPPVVGFTNLRRLEVVECVFGHDDRAMEPLGLPPVPPIEHLRVEGCEGLRDVSPVAGLTRLKTLALHECRDDYPDFDEAARVALRAKLLSGELNADGTGCLCKVVGRRLDIRRAEREAARLARCDAECCGPCDCGECSDCE